MKTSVIRTIACLAASITLFFIGTANAASLGTWPVINMGRPAKLFVSGVAYGNGTWVAVGQGGYIATSLDGVTWARRSAGITRDFNDVCFSNGRFIAVCKAPNTGTGAKIWVSSNGVTWAYRNTDAGLDTISVGLHSVASDGAGNLIAVGGSGWITRSYDNGESWHVLLTRFSFNSLYAVGYGNGAWMAAINGSGVGGLYRSTDGGTNWTTVSTTIGGTHLSFGNNRWVLAGNLYNRIYWSANGSTWKEAKTSAADGGGTYFQYPKGSVFRDGLFIVVTEYGNLWTSENGREFRLWRAAGLDPDAWCVGASDRLIVAAGSDFKAGYGLGWISPPWMRARLGSSWDYPYTVFDSEDGIVRGIGLPQYRVNTSSLNLLLEGTLFHMKTLGAPVNLRLVYNSAPVKDNSSAIGLFGKNWRLRYESFIGAFGTEAMVVTGGGRSLMFSTPNGEDLSTATPGSPLTLLPPDGIFDELKYYGPGQYFELKEKESKRVSRYGVSDAIGAVWRLTRITDNSGQQVSLVVDGPTGRISSITDPSSRSTTFAYNASNLCTQITVPDGRQLKFEYDSHKNLTKITDMAGYIATYAYDTMGYVSDMTVAGRKTTFAFNQRPGFEDSDSAQDNAGDKVLASVKDATGGITSYAILPNEGGVKRTDPRGKNTTFKSQKGQTASVTDPLGKVRQLEFSAAKLPASFTDAAGKITKYSYDARGNLTRTTDALNNQTNYTYDSKDNLSTRADALGQTTTWLYDSNDRVTRATTPAGNQTNITYFANGRVQTLRDARNNTTTFAYNGNGDLTGITDPLSNFNQLAYDTTGRATSATDARGKTKTFSYDANDRLLVTHFTSAPATPQRENTYDAFGQLSFTDELGQATNVVRNELGFPMSVTDPLGNTTSTAYDADNNPIQVTDALGYITKTTYDDASRPLVMTDPAGKTATKAYDSNGNLLSFTDKNANKTLFAYDANNLLLTTTDPLGKKVTNTRDALGRVSVITNARGQSIRLTFDADGRITKKEYKEDITPLGPYLTEATYTFDGNGNVTARTDDWGITNYTYDANNRTSNIAYPSGKSVSFTYNASGLPNTVTYPNGLVVTYAYDDFNHMGTPTISRSGPLAGSDEAKTQIASVQMTLSASTQTLAFTHNAVSNLTLIDRPGTLPDTSYTYDAANRLLTMNHAAGATTVLGRSYGLDATGNIASEETSGTLTVPEPLPEIATLSYSKLNQVIKRNTSAYTYDADGNLTAITGGLLTATYTPENRLTQLTRLINGSSQTATNVYDGNGLRVKRTVTGGAVTQFHYGPGDKLLFTTDGTGTLLACYIWKGNSIVAMTVGNSLATDLRYPLLNHLGSVMALMNPSATADTQYAYQPFGGYFKQTNAGSADPGLFTFIGGLGVQDEGNGLFLMKNRFYDSATGHFLQRDPTGLTGGINLYAYANANPFNFIDPNGTDSWGSWAWWGASKTVQAVGTGAVYVYVAGGVVLSAPAVGAAAATWAGYEFLEWSYGKLRSTFNELGNVYKDTEAGQQQSNPTPPPAPGSDAEFDREDARRAKVASQTQQLSGATQNAVDVHN